MEIVTVAISKIKPYPNNPRRNDDAVEKVAESIKQCGYIAPIIVDEDYVILAGHTRLKALKKLGRETVDVGIAKGLTDEQKRKYRLLDNKTGEYAEWDFEALNLEIEGLDFEGIDFEWNPPPDTHFWGDVEGVSSEEYEDFTEKFKPKLTTDDCYTPPLVYEAVKDWAIKEYGLDGVEVMRPFYPGGDYAKESYGTDCVVIDNPPFSILSEICRFYMKHNVRFFLFAPSLTLFSTARGECNYLPLGADVTYENGAVVSTSFITNLGDWKINTAPSLTIAINEAMAKTKEKNEAAELPQYEYPSEVVTPAKLATLAGKGANIKIKHAAFIRALASQREKGAAIFGGGMLISTTDAEKAAAEKAAAEKAKIIWELSDEEREIIARLADAP